MISTPLASFMIDRQQISWFGSQQESKMEFVQKSL
jgi:hypothetical protein